MKIFWNLLTYLLLSNLSLFAQELSKEFGQIRLSDFDYQYELEPTADAIVLFDIGETKFIETRGDLNIEFKRTKRIKINTKEGMSQGNIAIPFYVDGYGKTEEILKLEANIYYLENGALQQKKLDKEAVYTEKVNKYWQQQKFAFPNLQEGAIIEFQYILQTPFPVNLPDWEFQSSIPTVYSRYVAKLTPFYGYVFQLQGADKFHKRSYVENKGPLKRFAGAEYQDAIHTFEMINIPSFKDESYITSKKDYIIKLDFQLAEINSPQGGRQKFLTTYPKLIKELKDSEYFGRYLKKAKRLAKDIIAKEVVLNGTSRQENSKRIIEYVKANYKWNGVSSKAARKSPKEVIQQKTGNAAEINLLLLAFLEAAEIEAYPVLLSTRSHGKLNTTYPFARQFNYVLPLVKVENKNFLCDGTSPFTAFNKIPIRCMNDTGLWMLKDNPSWINLNTEIDSRITHRIHIRPNLATNQLDVAIKSQFTEIEAYLSRARHENKAASIQKELAKSNLENITDFSTDNYQALNTPYKIAFNANYALEGFDDKLLIRPFLNYPPSENLLKQPNRSYPVDLIYKRTYNYGSFIDIPEGYAALDLPAESKINNELGRFYYTIAKTKGQLKITASLAFKKAIYPPSDYAQLKEFIDLFVERLNEPIVLEK